MADRNKQSISAEHAAGLIYKTATPSANQVAKVRDLMRDGGLRQNETRPFTTTRGAVAEYLAAKELWKQEAQRAELSGAAGRKRRLDAESGATPFYTRASNDRQIRRVYSALLSEYFLSLITYRRARDHSEQFQKVVFCSQVLLLLAMLGVGVGVVHSIRSSGLPRDEPWMAEGRVRVQQDNSAEKKVVLKWIEANRPAGELLDILPAHPRPGGTVVRARLRFQMPEKASQLEDSVFVIDDQEEVIRTEAPDGEDERLAGQ